MGAAGSSAGGADGVVSMAESLLSEVVLYLLYCIALCCICCRKLMGKNGFKLCLDAIFDGEWGISGVIWRKVRSLSLFTRGDCMLMVCVYILFTESCSMFCHRKCSCNIVFHILKSYYTDIVFNGCIYFFYGLMETHLNIWFYFNNF